MIERMLYLVTCGAPLASRIRDGAREAADRGWTPVVVPTHAAKPWLEELDLSGIEVVSEPRHPGDEKRVPAPTAIAVVPTTFNTLTSWANGLANTYPLATLCAGLGAGIPTVAVPFAKHDFTGHPAWLSSLAFLRYAGVTLIDPSTGVVNAIEPVTSGSGDAVSAAFRWSWVLDQLNCR